jgi:methionyl aminopeptidase
LTVRGLRQHAGGGQAIGLKTEHEMEMMARAGRLLDSVLTELRQGCQAGVRTIDLDRLAEDRIRAGAARPGFLGYHGYPRSILVSIDDEVHGLPGQRRIEDGDVVSLDVGLVLDGFWADMSCTVGVGTVDAEAARLMEVTEECLRRAIDRMWPGGHLGDVSAAIQQHAEAAGFSIVRQFAGHGIGRQMHEDPQLPNLGVAGTGPELRPGITLAIEPMVNQGSPDIYVKPDGWTVCTADGGVSASFEHTVAVTRDGPRVLTSGAAGLMGSASPPPCAATA